MTNVHCIIPCRTAIHAEILVEKVNQALPSTMEAAVVRTSTQGSCVIVMDKVEDAQ